MPCTTPLRSHRAHFYDVNMSTFDAARRIGHRSNRPRLAPRYHRAAPGPGPGQTHVCEAPKGVPYRTSATTGRCHQSFSMGGAFQNCTSASQTRGKAACPRSQSFSCVHGRETWRTRALFTQTCTALLANRYNP